METEIRRCRICSQMYETSHLGTVCPRCTYEKTDSILSDFEVPLTTLVAAYLTTTPSPENTAAFMKAHAQMAVVLDDLLTKFLLRESGPRIIRTIEH